MAQMNMSGPADSFTQNLQRHNGSGTDLEPASSAPPMLMRMSGNWMQMLHGDVLIAEQQQTGPRGHDKLYSTNWAMLMAQRPLPGGQLTLRAMLSLEPATISGRYYPELFQQGETAFGKPIIDGQHPHNLFMELAALYDLKPNEHTTLSLYAAPVGDPALGPEAYPHRASAGPNPLAPLGHHQQDSTHIAYEVLTGGIAPRHRPSRRAHRSQRLPWPRTSRKPLDHLHRRSRLLVRAPHHRTPSRLGRAILTRPSHIPRSPAPRRKRTAPDSLRHLASRL